MTSKHTAYLLPILFVCLILLSACDRDDLHDDHHAHGIERIVVQGVETDVLYGLWREGDTGWTSGGSLSIDAGSDLSVRVAFVDDHGHEITLRDGGEYSLDIRFVDEDASRDVLSWTISDDVATFSGIDGGEAEVIFLLMHGNHSDAESPAFTVEIRAMVPVGDA